MDKGLPTNSKILLVDNEGAVRSEAKKILLAEGYEIDSVQDRSAIINVLQSKTYDVVLLDISKASVSGIKVLEFIKEKYPTTEVVMLAGVHDTNIAVECLKKGASHCITQPFRSDELLQGISRSLKHAEITRAHSIVNQEFSSITGEPVLIGQSKLFHQTVIFAERVATTNSPVLLQGESGTGKELFAKFIYGKSLHAGGQMVTVNCASISETLIESELFGQEQDEFTKDRKKKTGLVELADGGTLFLDEIGDIAPIIQPKLSRFIQTGEFRRVGGSTVHRANVRIISATNKNLHEEITRQRFREDLFYRLNVVTLTIPPLRNRKEDIPLLAENILKNKLRSGETKTLNATALQDLMNYHWPGNIRELENVLENASIFSQSNTIEASDLQLPRTVTSDLTISHFPSYIGSTLTIKEIERLHLSEVLIRTKWDKKTTAKLLGWSLKTLYTKIALYNLTQAKK